MWFGRDNGSFNVEFVCNNYRKVTVHRKTELQITVFMFAVVRDYPT
jgi:hypothetical protein